MQHILHNDKLSHTKHNCMYLYCRHYDVTLTMADKLFLLPLLSSNVSTSRRLCIFEMLETYGKSELGSSDKAYQTFIIHNIYIEVIYIEIIHIC